MAAPSHNKTPPNPDRGKEFKSGLLVVLPVLAGVIPFALVLGALATKKGISVAEVGLMSASVFAGSAQFTAIELWTTPASIGALGLMALVINLRHVLMGVAIAPHIKQFSAPARWLALFAMVDESWAMTMSRSVRAPITLAYYAGVCLPLYANWLVFTTVGALAGSLIDDPVALGFDFAFVAVFMTLIKGFWRGNRTVPVWLASAGVAVVVSRMFDGPWYVLAGAVAGLLVVLVQPQSALDPDQMPQNVDGS